LTFFLHTAIFKNRLNLAKWDTPQFPPRAGSAAYRLTPHQPSSSNMEYNNNHNHDHEQEQDVTIDDLLDSGSDDSYDEFIDDFFNENEGDEAMHHFLEEEMEFDNNICQILYNDSSDEDCQQSEWGGSKKGKAPNKKRDFQGAYDKLVRQYFSGRDSIYDDNDFCRRFRMSRNIFSRVYGSLIGKDPFIQKVDAIGKLGIHPLVKIVACIRFICYGDAMDRDDENLQISESSLHDISKMFSKMIIAEFGPQYLNRCPTKEEREIISRAMSRKGFPGGLGSWDCKHYRWNNCPLRLAGQHQGHGQGGSATLIMESISDFRRYFWYVNFGDPGSLNDLNVLDKSSIVGSMYNGSLDLRSEPYRINGQSRDWHYFLVDGIYPEWAIFVNTYQDTSDEKKRKFALAQERVRKDVECAFGILLQKFQVLQRPLRGWYIDEIRELLQSCVILHNMIQEERQVLVPNEEENVPEANDVALSDFPLFGRQLVTQAMAFADGVDLFAARMASFDDAMRCSAEHHRLKYDLAEHIYNMS